MEIEHDQAWIRTHDTVLLQVTNRRLPVRYHLQHVLVLLVVERCTKQADIRRIIFDDYDSRLAQKSAPPRTLRAAHPSSIPRKRSRAVSHRVSCLGSKRVGG